MRSILTAKKTGSEGFVELWLAREYLRCKPETVEWMLLA